MSSRLETKYRDTADGNFIDLADYEFRTEALETKYRDTADGNCQSRARPPLQRAGWKPSTAIQRMETPAEQCTQSIQLQRLETKYRDTADGN